MNAHYDPTRGLPPETKEAQEKRIGSPFRNKPATEISESYIHPEIKNDLREQEIRARLGSCIVCGERPDHLHTTEEKFEAWARDRETVAYILAKTERLHAELDDANQLVWAARDAGDRAVNDGLAQVAALQAQVATLTSAARKVLEGFDRGYFVRDTAGDSSPEWTLKLLPYIEALGELSAGL